MPKISSKPLRQGSPSHSKLLETPPNPDNSPSDQDISLTEQVDEGDLPPAIPIPAGATTTPAPPQFKFHTDSTRGKRPNDFFAYWCSLPPEFKRRQTAYVYRNWPVISIMVPDKKHGGFKSTCQIAKLPGEDAIRDEDDMLHRFGSGDYTIRLNDCTLRKTIALCVVKGLRNDEHQPCKPLDLLDVLVYDDPANQSFINNLRLRGILQDHEREQVKEEEDVSQTETVDRLTGLVEKQFEREQKRDQERRPAADSTELAAKTVNLASDALLKGIDLGRKAIENETATAVAKAKAESGESNPAQSLSMFKEVVGIVQSLIPKPAEVVSAPSTPAPAAGGIDLGAFLAGVAERESKLNSKVVELMQGQINALVTRIDKAAEAPALTTAPAQKDDFAATLDKVIATKDKIQAIFGGGGNEDSEREEKAPFWLQALQTGLAGLPTAIAGLVAMSYNMAIAKTGQGTPLPPGLPPPQPDAGTGMGIIAGRAELNPGGEEEMKAKATNVILSMLRQLEKPFLKHLNDPNESGATLAAHMMDLNGRNGYDAIREYPKEIIMGWLQSYPPIAEVISLIPERASQFVDDFLDADVILAAEEEADAAAEGLLSPEGDLAALPPHRAVPGRGESQAQTQDRLAADGCSGGR